MNMIRFFILSLSVALFSVLAMGLNSPGPSGLTTEEIEEIVLTDVYPLWSGDDGIDCSVDLVKVEKTFEDKKSIQLEVVGGRSESQHGCAPEIIECTVWIDVLPNQKWKSEFACR